MQFTICSSALFSKHLSIPFDSFQKTYAQTSIRSSKLYFSIAKVVMKIVEDLALFVVEPDVQKVLFHLVYAILKSMVDLDQIIILIMAVANH